MNEEGKCGRPSAGFLLWPGQDPTPMCLYHKEGPLKLGQMMGWPVTFQTSSSAGPCESLDPHPEDEKEPA